MSREMVLEALKSEHADQTSVLTALEKQLRPRIVAGQTAADQIYQQKKVVWSLESAIKALDPEEA